MAARRAWPAPGCWRGAAGATAAGPTAPGAPGPVLGGVVGAVPGHEISDKTGGSKGNQNVAGVAGAVAGAAAGLAQAEAAGREEALRLATTLENLEKCITELNQAVADDLLALSMEIARQLVRQTVAAKPDVVLGVIREALEQLPLLHAAVRLNPEDASLVRLRAGDQLTHAGHRIHEDPKLKRGDVIIEAGGSHLDASLASRWRRVVQALGQDAPWTDLG